jgi:hypothetical protein
MESSSGATRPRRFGLWTGTAFLVTFGVSMMLVVGNQQRQIHEFQGELRELQKEHRALKTFVREPPVRIDPLAARIR